MLYFCRMANFLNSAHDSALLAFLWGLTKVLAAGPVPQHIAFIMDGNRRYARERNMAIKEGHANGFYALEQVRTSPLLVIHAAYVLCAVGSRW